MATEMSGRDIWGIGEYYPAQLLAVSVKMNSLHIALLMAQDLGDTVAAIDLDELLFDLTNRQTVWGELLFPPQ